LKDFSGIMGGFSNDSNHKEHAETPARLNNISTIDYNKCTENSDGMSPKLPNCRVSISPHPISSSRSPRHSGFKNSLTFNEGDHTQSIGTY
jgi:hypothetical protein